MEIKEISTLETGMRHNADEGDKLAILLPEEAEETLIAALVNSAQNTREKGDVQLRQT
ncbi:MAG: hypothetical protein ACLU3N_04105 [Lachnospiraceae bacterium]